MEIKILGGGCKSCELLYENVVSAKEEMGIEASVTKVNDPIAVAGYGIIRTPAVVVDEKVVSYGKVLKPAEVKKILEKIK
jgi:small redox-active disulfide protein 2